MGEKPMKQQFAVAMNTQRMARKKMAKGGLASTFNSGKPHSAEEMADHPMGEDGKCMAHGGMCGYYEGGTVDGSYHKDDFAASPGYYDGGEVLDADEQRILGIMRQKYSKGGEVDLQANENEHLNDEDDMSYDAAREDYYDLDQMDDQPEDSNEKGDDMDERDQGDKLDKLAKYKKKK